VKRFIDRFLVGTMGLWGLIAVTALAASAQGVQPVPRMFRQKPAAVGKGAAAEADARAVEAGKDEAARKRGEDAAGEDEEDEQQTDIHFDTYPDADANLRLAERMLAENDYPFAFRVYTSVLDKWSDLMFKVETNRYYGISRLARKRLMMLADEDLGPEGVAAKGRAMREFGKARAAMDVETLERLAERYFWTPIGPQARELLGDIYLERDEAVSAVHAYYRLLRDFDLPGADRLRIARKTVAALAVTGDRNYRVEILRELAATAPQTPVSDGDEIVPAAELLDRVEKRMGSMVDRETDWPRFMGNVRRTGSNLQPAPVNVLKWKHYIEAPGDERAHQVTVKDMGGNRVVVAGGGQVFVNGKPVNASGSGGGGGGAAGSVKFNSHPIVSRGRVVQVEGDTIVALDLATGDLIWEVGNPFVSADYSPKANGRNINSPAMLRMLRRRGMVPQTGRSWTVSARGDVVYAMRPTASGLEILAIDVVTGKRLGKVPSATYSPSFLESGAIASGMAENGGRLYVAYADSVGGGSRNRYGGGFEDARMVCIDMQDPRRPQLLWDSKLYGRATGYHAYGGNQTVKAVHIPAAAEGSVFYNSNDGALVSLDAMTGEIQWAYSYEKFVQVNRRFGRNRGPQKEPPDPCFTASPIVRDGQVFVAPSDAFSMYAFDAATGEPLWSQPREGLYYVVGLYNDLLIVHGERVEARHWQTGEVAWTAPVSGLEPAGKGCLAGDAVAVPVRRKTSRGFDDRIVFFDAATGVPLEDRTIRLEQGEHEVGNLVLADGTLLSANSKRLNAFGNWQTQFERLGALLEADPNDSNVLFQLGSMYARRGDFAEAIGIFKKALEHVGPEQTYQERPLANVLKERLYRFYRDKTLLESDAGQLAQALETATSGLKYTLNDIQVVELRFARARLMAAMKNPAKAALEYQTIVNKTPGVTYVIDGGKEIAAGMYASVRIRRLIDEAGREAYRLVEDEARELLASNDPKKWRRIVADYGPARARPEAMLKLADYERTKQNDIKAAARYLKRFFIGYTEDERALTKALESVALYEKSGSLAQAALLLKRIERHAPEATTMWKGKRVTGLEIARRELERPELARLLSLRGATLYPVDLPLQKAWEAGKLVGNKWGDTSKVFEIDGRQRLATVVNNPTALTVKNPDGTTLWQHRDRQIYRFAPTPDGNRILVADSGGVVCLDSRTGKLQWKQNPQRLNLLGGHKLHQAQPTGVAIQDNVACFSYIVRKRQGRRIVQSMIVAAWYVDSGKLAWVGYVDGIQQGGSYALIFDRLALVGDSVVTATRAYQGSKGAIHAFAIDTGKLRAKADLPGQGAMTPPRALDESRVVVGYNDGRKGGVQCFNIDSGKTEWRGQCNQLRPNHYSDIKLAADRVALISQQGVEVFDAETGKLAWFVNEQKRRRMVHGVAMDPAAMYVMTIHQQTRLDAQVQRIDLETGKRTWAYDVDKNAATHELGQSQDRILLPVMYPHGKPRGNRRHMNMFRFDKAALICIDKETGKQSMKLDVAQFNPTQSRNTRLDLLKVTVGEEGVFLDVLGGTIALRGGR
jgi:outer membrane protein assembly factor BamB